jgi:hypothetical protein
VKRRRQELSIFSLSALDVLAMSTGVFVLLLVLLMPYYRKTFDAQAALGEMQRETAEALATAAGAGAEAERRAAEVSGIEAEAARAEAAAASLERPALREPAPRPSEPAPTAAVAPAETRTVDALDLIFVIDTTVSMTPALEEMAASMRAITRILERLVPSVRIGVVAYRDRDTGLEPIEVLPPTATEGGLPRIVAFVESLSASPVGSRTVEEDVYLGLQAALALPLRPQARQAIVVIGDAAAHPEESQTAFALAQGFARRSAASSLSALFVTTPGSLRRGQIDRRFFQTLARAGGGAFTDHAGSMVESVLLSVLVD